MKYKCCVNCDENNTCENICDRIVTCGQDPVVEECYDMNGECYEYIFKIGDRINHNRHGAGVITSLAPEPGFAILVAFDKVPPVANGRWIYVSACEMTKLGGK